MRNSKSGPSLQLIELVCLSLVGFLNCARAQFSYANSNQGMEFVPYGGSFTYAVTWTNGTYNTNGTLGTWVHVFTKPTNSLTINSLYPADGGFSYTISSVTSSDDGSYSLMLDGSGTNTLTTSPISMHVTPGIVQQPTNTVTWSGQTNSMGLVAGPTGVTYTWIDAATGSTLATGLGFVANTSMSGKWVYCRISNSYGYVITSPAFLTVNASSGAGGFGYTNVNQALTIVAYGSAFTYSVAWTNGYYSYNNASGTWVTSLSKPGGSVSISGLYPANGAFTYTIPSVSSSDDGQYSLTLNGGGGSITTTPVAMHVAPSIVTQPTDMTVSNYTSTTMGMVAGPSSATFTWYDANTGSTLATGSSFMVSAGMDGKLVYCRISNSYGFASSQPVRLHVPIFTYTNGSPATQIVPYGGTYTYSLSWGNGTYSYNGMAGVWINTLYKPSGSVSISGFYPSPGNFSYTIPFVTGSDDGSYYVTLNAGSSSPSINSVYLRVGPGIVLQPVESTVNNGANTTMGLVAGPPNATFAWVDAATGSTIANGSSFYANNSLNGKTVYCRISNTYGNVCSAPVVLHVGPTAPTIVTQPANVTVVLGQSASFQVAATGAVPLSYSWYHNGYLIDGAGLNYLTINSTTNTDAGAYACVISNSLGRVSSATAYLSFATYPILLTQPQSLIVTQGQTAVLSALATGTPLSFYWSKNGTAIEDATNSSFTITNATLNDAGTYTLTVSNGLAAVASTGAVLTVYCAPVITMQPSDLAVAAGASGNLAVTAEGGLLSYQWYRASTNLAEAAPTVLNGFVVGAAVSYGGGGYLAAPSVQISGGGGSGASATASISNGMVTAVNILTSGAGYTNAPAIQIAPPYGALTNQTNNTLNFNPAKANNAGTYFVVVSNPVGTQTSSDATVTINLPPYILTQPKSLVVSNGASATFDVLAAGDAPLAYQWYGLPATQKTASAAALVMNGFVYGANLVSGGNGYTSVPAVRIVGGGGSGAAASAVINDGAVVAVNVDNAGLGYTNIPTIQIDPPTGLVIADETNATYTIAAVSTNQMGWYYVMVTNPLGSVTSSLASLDIAGMGPSSNGVQHPIAPLLSLSFSPGRLQFHFAGSSNYPYVLQTATNLTPPINWQSVLTNPSDANGNWNFADTNVSSGQRFYRVVGQ